MRQLLDLAFSIKANPAQADSCGSCKGCQNTLWIQYSVFPLPAPNHATGTCFGNVAGQNIWQLGDAFACEFHFIN